MTFPPLANAQIVIHPFEPGDAGEFLFQFHHARSLTRPSRRSRARPRSP